MKKIIKSSLNLLSKAIAAACLFTVSMATGTISLFNNYELEMPAALRPKDSEESV